MILCIAFMVVGRILSRDGTQWRS